ncbi:hypothetical protein QW71_12925 [Paenibacillus sp. IHB B 3415]|uniref:helix-turn-helix domain-containing protein n=1 Tax=Paenibacillus sp. IHB B 3415 TaxID=867080 RepID=UPI0005739A6F|nr:helix-turn-helix transcriptional regulator [Paenibacillus sp. IHB B 3415]KHL95363.1 hypothetical protein QW71_12925 [Paenibacillus sp. IHB B 3415]
MSTILPKTESKAEFLTSSFTRIIANGKLPALFNLVMAEGRRILDDDNYESVDEKRNLLNTTLGETKQALSIAVKRTIRCCGFPLEVRGGYDRKTGHHSLLVRCNHCGYSLYVEEQREPRYVPGRFKRQAAFAPKRTAPAAITLRRARERAGYTEVAAAKLLGIKTKRLRELELDCSKTRLNLAERFCELYRCFSLDQIHWGREEAYKQKGEVSHA